MKELQQYLVTRSIHLDHEQLLLLEDRPGARIKLIYRGACLTPEEDDRERGSRVREEVALWARGRSIIALMGRVCAELTERLPSGGLRRFFAAVRRRLPALQGL